MKNKFFNEIKKVAKKLLTKIETMKNQETKNEIDQLKTRLSSTEQTIDEFEEDLQILFNEMGKIRNIFKKMKNIGLK